MIIFDIIHYLIHRFLIGGRITGALIPIFFDALRKEYPEDEAWLDVIIWWVNEEQTLVLEMGDRNRADNQMPEHLRNWK